MNWVHIQVYVFQERDEIIEYVFSATWLGLLVFRRNDLCEATVNSKCAHTWQTDAPAIQHRSLENHYTASISWQTDPTPPPIDLRSMEDHTPLLKLTIDLWKTTTLHQFHGRLTPPPSSNWPQTYARPLHQLCFTYRCMYRYQCRPHPLLQSTIDLWKTTTLHQFHGRLTPSPSSNWP